MTLRDIAEANDLEIGACATLDDLEDDRYAELLGDEFNVLALENDLKWATVHPERKGYAFDRADRLIDFAERHDMVVTGHALAWHIQNPDWLTQQDWNESELREVFRSHIHTVTDRYSDRIAYWDVVNEAVDDDGELRDNVWLEHLGASYIPSAFRWASEKTDAALFYNEYGLPYNEAKRERVHDLLAELLDRGVPVDGVGIQLHCVGVHPSMEQLRTTIERFQELGLTVRISELDVAYRTEDRPDDLAATQAAYYGDLVRTCLDAGVEHIALWGVLDDHSWITTWRDYPDRYTQQPLLFDADGERKRSYEAVASALQQVSR